jgi:hypothetical protein
MTDLEAKNFVEQVLQGLWPRWEPKDEELRGWVSRLAKYDYDRGRQAVNNAFFDSDSHRIAPSPGKVFAALRQHARLESQKKQGEPLLLYEVVKEGKDKGMRFFLPSGEPRNRQQLQEEAERVRQNCNGMYKTNHIVRWHYDAVPF